VAWLTIISVPVWKDVVEKLLSLSHSGQSESSGQDKQIIVTCKCVCGDPVSSCGSSAIPFLGAVSSIPPCPSRFQGSCQVNDSEKDRQKIMEIGMPTFSPAFS
jgi:hypothetical protein